MASLETSVEGEILTVAISGQLLDEVAIQSFEMDLSAVLKRHPQRMILLHFGQVTFMVSATLGAVVRFRRKCHDCGARIKVANLHPLMVQLFARTGLDRVFEIYPDAADAVAAFQKET
jgi:anti-anti-sigma factor